MLDLIRVGAHCWEISKSRGEIGGWVGDRKRNDVTSKVRGEKGGWVI